MIKLNEQERAELESFSRRGTTNARNITRAQVLLKSSEGWSISDLAKMYQVSEATVSNVRKRYREAGLEGVLKDKVQKNRRRALAGAEEAFLVAVACSPVPEGHDHWTVRMLRDKLVEMGVVERISVSTLHDRLKKMNLNPGSASSGASRRR